MSGREKEPLRVSGLFHAGVDGRGGPRRPTGTAFCEGAIPSTVDVTTAESYQKVNFSHGREWQGDTHSI